MYEVHFFTLPYYFGYSLRYFSSQKMWLLFHDALQQSFWTYSLQVPIKSHLHLQIPNQLIPRLCKRTIYTSYTILSIWSIYIINNWCLPPTWFVFVFFFVYILHLQLVVPPSTRLYYCIINGAFSSHNTYDVEKKLLHNYWTFQICHTSNQLLQGLEELITESSKKNTISVCKFFRSYDSLSRKRIK